MEMDDDDDENDDDDNDNNETITLTMMIQYLCWTRSCSSKREWNKKKDEISDTYECSGIGELCG